MQEQQSLFYLSNVLKNYKVSPEDAAHIMFPTNKNANLALRRVLRGDGRVFIDQLEALAQHLGITVTTLYEAGCDMWKDVSKEVGVFCIVRGIFTAKYDFDTRRLTISTTSGIIHNSIMNRVDISVKDLMQTINNIINGTYSSKCNY